LRVLATARRRLELKVEWVYPLSGLSLEPAEPDGRSDAARLFLTRARQLGSGPLDPHAVEALCRETDGHPLAIELAASWTPILPLPAIVERLVRGGDLSARHRDLPPRQRNLAEIVETSYRLLPREGRRAFRRLSVFQGGFSPESAVALGAASAEDLALLVDRALLGRRRDRLYLHPLLATHARAHLEARPGEARVLRLRHARHFLEPLSGRDWLDHEGLAAFARELGNLRAAWSFAAENGLWHELGDWSG